MKLNEVKFVVAGVATGDKVEVALNKRLPVVKVEWLHKSAETGYLVDPAEHAFFAVRTSSPTSRTGKQNQFIICPMLFVNLKSVTSLVCF